MNKGLGSLLEDSPAEAGLAEVIAFPTPSQHAVEMAIGRGRWSRLEFPSEQRAQQYLAGAVACAARPQERGWWNGRMQFRLTKGDEVLVHIEVNISHPQANADGAA